jgi:serine/threonine protein kinase
LFDFSVLSEVVEISVEVRIQMRFSGQTETHTSFPFTMTEVLSSNPRTQTQVYRAQNESTGAECVLKIYSMQNINAFREYEILSEISHRAILPLEKVVYTDMQVALVLPFARGGDLYNVITKRSLSEHEASHLFGRIAEALAYLHDRGICHGDVKLENILCLDEAFDPKGCVLCDFEFAIEVGATQMRETSAGTFWYEAPEVMFSHTKSTKSDIWSLGISIFVALTGGFPFDWEDEVDVKAEVAEGLPNLPDLMLESGISQDCQNLLIRMCKADPDERPSADEVLSHPWMRQPAD